jgi:hypothetical protein
LSQLTEPSSLVLDIGANIGAHTLHLAGLVGPKGRVMAFETTDFAFGKLRRNLDLNPPLASGVEAFHCFLTASDQASVPDAIYSSCRLPRRQGCTPLCGTKVLLRKDYEVLARERAYFGNFDPFGDFDLIFGAAKQNLKIIETPIHYKARTFGETQISRFRDGWLLLKMVWFAYRKLKAI